MRLALAAGGLLFVAALGGALWKAGLFAEAPSSEPGPADIARAESLRPADADLAAIYERSCAACHAFVDAQAPLAGHSAGWAPRLAARGLDGLIISAQQGYGNMPAMGLCNDCSREEMRALIEFMAGLGEQG